MRALRRLRLVAILEGASFLGTFIFDRSLRREIAEGEAGLTR